MMVDCIADVIIGSRLLTIFIVVILATIEIHATSDANVECCPGNSVSIKSRRNCSDGSIVRMHCPNHTRVFKLNPNFNVFQDFEIVENNDTYSAHLKLLYNGELIPPTEFCVSEKHEKNRSALVCLPKEKPLWAWRWPFLGILDIISAVFLFLTLAVHLILPELRTIQDKATVCTVAIFACHFVILAVTHIHPWRHYVLCNSHGKCVWALSTAQYFYCHITL